MCVAAGDIASLDVNNRKNSFSRHTTLADPLWHHVTHEPEELSFHTGDVIQVCRQALCSVVSLLKESKVSPLYPFMRLTHTLSGRNVSR